MARYGPINFCSTGGASIVFDTTAAFCAVSAYLAVVNAFNGEFATDGNSVVGYMSRLGTVIQFLFQGAASAAAPSGPPQIARTATTQP